MSIETKQTDILSLIYDILHDATLIGDTYDEQTAQKIIRLIPEFLDPSKAVLIAAIKHVLGLSGQDEVEFANGTLIVRRINFTGQSQTLLKTAQDIQDEEEYSNTITIALADVLEELGVGGYELTNNLKDKIRAHIRAEVKLYEKDMILFLNDKIIIKRFNRTTISKPIEKRFNGLPKEELSVVRRKILRTITDEEKFVAETTQKAMYNEINFGAISAASFQKTYVKSLQKYLQEGIALKLNDEPVIIEGLSNLILRENWVLVHRLMASKILELLGDKTHAVEVFLRYYSGDVQLGEDKVRYKQPEILDVNNQKWNGSTMLGMVLQRRKNIERKKQLEKVYKEFEAKVLECDKKITEVEIEVACSLDEIKTIEDAKQDMIAMEKVRDTAIKNLTEAIKRETDSARVRELKEELGEYIRDSKTSLSREDTLKKRKIALEELGKSAKPRIEAIQREKLRLQKKLKEEEDKISALIASFGQFNEKYSLMSDALSSALMKRPTKI